jgi:hypothetical protein
MIDEKYLELVNKEIDGEITPKEKERLEKYIEENPELKQLYIDMIKTSDLLDEVEEMEPSINLKKSIINSLDPNLHKKAEKESVVNRILNIFLPHPKYRVAFAFVLGLFVGFLVLNTFFYKQQTLEISDLYGTIGLNENSNYENLENFPVQSPDINGAINIKRKDDVLFLEMALKSHKEYDLLVRFNPENLYFIEFIPHSKNEFVISNQDNYLQTTCLGDNKFIFSFLLLNKELSDLHIELLSEGSKIFEKNVFLNK